MSTHTIATADLPELLALIDDADSVELKATVPDSDRQSMMQALEMDPIDAEIRQVFFFDTPGLDLYHHGVVVRARRSQRKGGDAVVKLRPVVPHELPKALRRAPGFKVEVDALPGAFMCSGSLAARADATEIKEVAAGARPLKKLLTREQRELYKAHARGGIGLGELSVLGPIMVLKLKAPPVAFARRLVAELWFYPDDTRILELSTKCPPDDAFRAAAETRSYLAQRGIDIDGEQETKTRRALDFFAARLQSAARDG
jgi:hypothetical protein